MLSERIQENKKIKYKYNTVKKQADVESRIVLYAVLSEHST